MPVSSVQPGYSIIQQATNMADDAARDIQRNQAHSTESDLAFNKVEQAKPKPVPDNVDALIDLNQAKQYSRIGTNVIQREQDMIGSLLDIRV